MQFDDTFEDRDLRVTYLPPGDLKPYANNPRTHSKKQVRQIADSMKTFGFTNPILIDSGEGVIAGHGRLEAAKLLGVQRVPTIRLDEMTEAQKRAYIIADNKLAENAGWDQELLAIELDYLLEIETEFDISVIGFEPAEIDLVLSGSDGGSSSDPLDEAPEVPLVPVSSLGDLWLLGKHRLYCGDATDRTAFARLMDGKQAQMVFSDPPYNVPIAGNVSGLGSVKHGEFVMASGEMTVEAFTVFLKSVLGHMADVSVDGAIHYICMDWRHMGELISAGADIYDECKNLCVWAKTNGGMGSLYRSQHELVFVYKAGKAPHINNVELGRHGRNRTNLWSYAGVNSLKKDRGEELAMHPTVKPVAMVEDAIFDCSKRNGIVLDAFSGSGTTLIAAEKTGRIGYGMELDPRYVDVAIKRWSKLTGEDAIHAESGLSFQALS